MRRGPVARKRGHPRATGRVTLLPLALFLSARFSRALNRIYVVSTLVCDGALSLPQRNEHEMNNRAAGFLAVVDTSVSPPATALAAVVLPGVDAGPR